MSNVTLVVYVPDGNVIRHSCDSHAQATRLSHSMYAGATCKIEDTAQRTYHADMRSYADKMAKEYY